VIDNLAVFFSCTTMIWLTIAVIRRNRARLREDKSRERPGA
jgi:hypothetical protein